ncbi:MAG: hypothetical protein LBP95_02450 [Deltaproteobacteria bacterium]|jgi:hypothetical protein|nr:hypothetical protein [Deltaproteobacteria bacterium]
MSASDSDSRNNRPPAPGQNRLSPDPLLDDRDLDREMRKIIRELDSVTAGLDGLPADLDLDGDAPDRSGQGGGRPDQNYQSRGRQPADYRDQDRGGDRDLGWPEPGRDFQDRDHRGRDQRSASRPGQDFQDQDYRQDRDYPGQDYQSGGRGRADQTPASPNQNYQPGGQSRPGRGQSFVRRDAGDDDDLFDDLPEDPEAEIELFPDLGDDGPPALPPGLRNAGGPRGAQAVPETRPQVQAARGPAPVLTARSPVPVPREPGLGHPDASSTLVLTDRLDLPFGDGTGGEIIDLVDEFDETTRADAPAPARDDRLVSELTAGELERLVEAAVSRALGKGRPDK